MASVVAVPGLVCSSRGQAVSGVLCREGASKEGKGAQRWLKVLTTEASQPANQPDNHETVVPGTPDIVEARVGRA